MPFWTDVAGFCFATIVTPLLLLHLWAFIYPNGKVSKRLHSPSDSRYRAEDREFILYRFRRLEGQILQGQRVPPQPDPFEDVELVTTMRRSPRRRLANNAIDGPQEPGP